MSSNHSLDTRPHVIRAEWQMTHGDRWLNTQVRVTCSFHPLLPRGDFKIQQGQLRWSLVIRPSWCPQNGSSLSWNNGNTWIIQTIKWKEKKCLQSKIKASLGTVSPMKHEVNLKSRRHHALVLTAYLVVLIWRAQADNDRDIHWILLLEKRVRCICYFSVPVTNAVTKGAWRKKGSFGVHRSSRVGSAATETGWPKQQGTFHISKPRQEARRMNLKQHKTLSSQSPPWVTHFGIKATSPNPLAKSATNWGPDIQMPEDREGISFKPPHFRTNI